MTALPTAKTIRADLRASIGFYTLIPVGRTAEPADFALAQWAAPIAGLVVACAGGAVFALVHALGVTPLLAATLALTTTIAITGCLHEDGLADVADGFGGGATMARKLEIMKDSRIGTYGVLALLSAFTIRLAALAALATPIAVAEALVPAHVASRAILPAFMSALPPARRTGLSAGIGPLPTISVRIAVGLGALGLLVSGFWTTVLGCLSLAIWFAAMRWLARTQINGQTGDVLGALQQGAEAIVLVISATTLT